MRVRRIAFLGVALAGACSNNNFGQSVLRPTYTATPQPTLLPITITEVYFSDSQPEQRFALLMNAGDSDITDISLQGHDPTVNLPLPAIPPGEFEASLAGFTGVGLFGGELAAVDGDGVVQAYLAWGADPALTGSQLAAPAVVSGVTQAGAYVPAGYPLPAGIAIVQNGAARGCAAATHSMTTLGPITPCPLTVRTLTIDRLLPGFDETVTNTWVSIANLGSWDADLFGTRLCYGTCAVVPHDLLVAAGDRVTIHLGPHGDIVDSDALAGQGELALFAPGGAEVIFAAQQLTAYVRYGNGSVGFLDAAVTAGLWPSAAVTALAPRIAGEMLLAASDPGVGPQPFVPAQLTESTTPPIGPVTDLWTSSSYPRPRRPSPRSTLVVSSLTRATAADDPNPHADLIVLSNRDTANVPLAGVELVVVTDGVAATLDLGTTAAPEIAAGAQLTIALQGADAGCVADVCWPEASLAASGEVALLSASALIQYVAYGDSGNGRLYAATAVAGNLWPGALGTYAGVAYAVDCAAGALAAGSAGVAPGSISLDLRLDGTSPPDWQ